MWRCSLYFRASTINNLWSQQQLVVLTCVVLLNKYSFISQAIFFLRLWKKPFCYCWYYGYPIRWPSSFLLYLFFKFFFLFFFQVRTYFHSFQLYKEMFVSMMHFHVADFSHAFFWRTYQPNLKHCNTKTFAFRHWIKYEVCNCFGNWGIFGESNLHSDHVITSLHDQCSLKLMGCSDWYVFFRFSLWLGDSLPKGGKWIIYNQPKTLNPMIVEEDSEKSMNSTCWSIDFLFRKAWDDWKNPNFSQGLVLLQILELYRFQHDCHLSLTPIIPDMLENYA